jgi:DNA-binding winged helix-turn-helix (wHTH) protein
MSQSDPISPQLIRFGIFELDLQAGELRRNGARVKLQEQPLHILEALVQNPGRVVSREDLRKQIWPADTFVDFDRGLYSAPARLREA